MNKRAGKGLGVAILLAAVAGVVSPANAQGLSEKAIRTFMEYAWSLTPQQFSKPDGTVIQIDKTKRDEILPSLEEALEIIKAGRLSAHAQMCELRDEQVANHRALMRREIAKKKWTPQQEVYISQLHLTTVMLLNGKIKLIEKDGEQGGDKEVLIDETKAPTNTCTEEQRQKVRQMVVEYVKGSPPPPQAAAPPQAAPKAVAPKAEGSAAPAGTNAASKAVDQD